MSVKPTPLVFKSNERSEYCYIGCDDFFFFFRKMSQNLFTRSVLIFFAVGRVIFLKLSAFPLLGRQTQLSNS